MVIEVGGDGDRMSASHLDAEKSRQPTLRLKGLLAMPNYPVLELSSDFYFRDVSVMTRRSRRLPPAKPCRISDLDRALRVLVVP